MLCKSRPLPVGTHATMRGFGFVELLVTISIIGLLLTVALPSMTRFIAQWQVTDTLNAFSSSLRVARAEAIKRGRAVYMCRSNNGTSCATGMPTEGWQTGWIIYVDNNGSGVYDPTIDVLLKVQNTVNTIDSIGSTAGLSNFRFSSTGILNTGMQGLTFNSKQMNASANSIYLRGLCISRTGRTRVVADGSTDCTSL